MDATNMIETAKRGRWAVATAFFVNGFITGSWAPQIPVFLTRLDMSETMLGLLLLLFGAGAIVFMSWCGYLIARHGSRNVVRWFGPAAALGLPIVALAPSLPLAALAMILFGGVIGGMDVAMNANAVAVERRLSRAIMSSSHGFWSLGGFAGGGIGGIIIQNYGHVVHAVLVAVVAAILLGASLRHLIVEERHIATGHRKFSLPKNPVIYLIGIMALFSMVPEGSVLDWAALYLKQELGADIATAGFAFACFAGTMAAVRFMGDAVRNRFGAVTTLRVSALIAASGMLVAGFAPTPWVAIAAFAFCGLGIANMVPIAFSAAGNQPGMSAGAGMSVVTTMGYSGILVAPSAIGFIGQHVGFSPVFISVSALLIVVFLMSGLARHADFAPKAQLAE
ncbi:MFS transporter [Pseudaminobacter salicylatoxidans]|uniref:MFS transporter n=1 Tax=Pseudaminobacter salicylatoxidans TaxID=93369 RepID=UPI00030CD8B4|nr:MFS transporter [Pseudaminobacter salicylatoxidans]